MSYDEIIASLDKIGYCVLALANNNKPYLVPMCYKMNNSYEELLITMSSKNKGKKMDYITCNNEVSVLFLINKFNCKMSIIGYGEAKIIDNDKDAYIKIKINKISGRIYY